MLAFFALEQNYTKRRNFAPLFKSVSVFPTLNALAEDFADKLGAALKSAAGLAGSVTVTASNVTPSSTTSVGGDSDYIISFLLTFGSAHGINDAICQFYPHCVKMPKR